MNFLKSIHLQLKNVLKQPYEAQTGGAWFSVFGEWSNLSKILGMFLALKIGIPIAVQKSIFYRLYLTGWGRKFIEWPTKTAWTFTPQINEKSTRGSELTNTPAFSRAANELLDPQMIRVAGVSDVQNKLMKAYNDMRVGQFGAIILQLSDLALDDYGGLKMPVMTTAPALLNFFSLTDQYITENINQATGKINSYQLELVNGTFDVHPQRVIRLTKNGELYHTPDMQYAWPDLVTLFNLPVASMFSSASATAKTLITMDKAPGSDLARQIQPTSNGGGVLTESQIQAQGRNLAEGVSPVLVAIGQGTKAEFVPPQTLNIMDPQQPHIENLAAFLNVPMPVFLGRQVSHLSGELDQIQWEEILGGIRQDITETVISKFLNKLVKLQALPTPRAGVYSIGWERPEVEKKPDDIDNKSSNIDNNNSE